MQSLPATRSLITSNQPPIPDAYWVVPGRLLAGEYPGAKMDAEARRKLRLFLGAGVNFFLDLTEEAELAPNPSRTYLPLISSSSERPVWTRSCSPEDTCISAGRRTVGNMCGGFRPARARADGASPGIKWPEDSSPRH